MTDVQTTRTTPAHPLCAASPLISTGGGCASGDGIYILELSTFRATDPSLRIITGFQPLSIHLTGNPLREQAISRSAHAARRRSSLAAEVHSRRTPCHQSAHAHDTIRGCCYTPGHDFVSRPSISHHALGQASRTSPRDTSGCIRRARMHICM